MARSVILGNGRLTVGLNEKGLVHDFYYPYVGLENLTTARSVHHKIGVWVDGMFSWAEGDDWQSTVGFSSEALISNVTLTNLELEIHLQLNDFVDQQTDTFCRTVTVHNDSESHKSVRLFMHQVFEISRGGRADTALYVPDGNYILDYKGRCTLLISGKQHGGGASFDQYAVGNYGIEGKKGTYMDAEDGELSGHLVEHGGVDSVIRFSLEIEPHASESVDYWIIASDTQYNGEIVHAQMQDGLSQKRAENEAYWQRWLATGSSKLDRIPAEYRDMTQKSLMVIKAHTDVRGGIIASCDSSIYNFGRDYYSYVWPRDGAYAMWPLIKLGYVDEPKAFFNFCNDILTPDGYLMHKYQPDRAIGSTWHPLVHNNRNELAIQEDETAVVIFMIGEFHHESGDDSYIKNLFDSFVVPAAGFMCRFIDQSTGLPHASYDLWEEKFLTSTYSTAVTYKALLVAAELAGKFGTSQQVQSWTDMAAELLEKREVFVNPDNSSFRKGFLLTEDSNLQFENTLDVSSLYGVITYDYQTTHDYELVQRAMTCVEKTLLNQSPSGGSPRYQNDYYFRISEEYAGNPWVISSLWMAQFYLKFGRADEAKAIVDWAQYHALPSGVMPEQIHPVDGSAVSVTPLVWSHAEFINTVLELPTDM